LDLTGARTPGIDVPGEPSSEGDLVGGEPEADRYGDGTQRGSGRHGLDELGPVGGPVGVPCDLVDPVLAASGQS
jgi:hypothetical protein